MSINLTSRAASFSGSRSEYLDQLSLKPKKRFSTLTFFKKSKSNPRSRLSSDSTLIAEPAFYSNAESKSSFTDNPFSSVADYRKAAQESQDPAFRFQFAKFLIDTAYETHSKFFIDEARQWLEILANPSLIQTSKSQDENAPAQPGFAPAQYMLANWYMSGSYDIEINEEKAFDLYRRAALQGHPSSNYLLGKCYQDGIGTEKNETYARKVYQKASILGDSRASYVLGMAFIHGGIGLETNPHLFLSGIDLLKRCITDTNGEFYRDALYELFILHSGLKVTKSRLKEPVFALSCLATAANLDHDRSQYQLGYIYEHGLLNVPSDSYRSIFWYSRAAALGNADACLGLSGWYLTGADGVLPKSSEDAYLWARKSADKGSSRGHFAVGYFLENGIGVEKNKSQAKKWYKRAASMGEKKAISRLDTMKSHHWLFRSSSGSLKSNFNFF